MYLSIRNGETLRGGEASVNWTVYVHNGRYLDELRFARIKSETGKPSCWAIPTTRW